MPAAESSVLAMLVLLPAAAGTALLVAGRHADRAAGSVAAAATITVTGLAVVAADIRPAVSAPFVRTVDSGAFALAVDGLSAAMLVMLGLTSLAVVAFGTVDLPADAARARFFGFLLLFVAAMSVTVTATTLPALLLGWEVMGAMSYALIGFHWRTPGTVRAGTTAFVTTRSADTGLYIAAGAVLAGSGTLGLDALSGMDNGWRHVAAAGILVAAFGKSAQLPFSGWLSAAMQGPSPVSALLHSATMVAAGGYLLLRALPLLEITAWAATTTAWVGAVTALVLGAVACAQSDLKQALAASTAAQIGFVVLAAGAGASAGGLGHLLAHAGVKAGLFVAVGAWLTALGTSGSAGQRGAGRRYPAMGTAAALGCAVLAGVPPLGLWATKDEVLAGVDGAALHITALAAGVLAAVYAGRILATVLGPPSPAGALHTEEPGTLRVPGGAVAVATGLIVGAGGLGVVAVPAVADAVKDLLDAPGEPAPSASMMVLSGALAVGALTATLARPRRITELDRTVLARWAALPRLLSARPVAAVARFAAAVDDHGIDRAARRVGAGVRRLAGRIGAADGAADRLVHDVAGSVQLAATTAATGDVTRVDRVVRGVASTLRAIGESARRPQSGLLHQYYATAAAGLGALFLLLLVVR
ncbi:proton-conducting transporter transmembrane domain-containing protein [Phytoactinopolyspora halotolerans]|uniref:NADH-quinone oxidoreductase subunit L n=1 Tax=Phytoactinopolyspora halotolerans TaxID=1981512 RepID=A0A6L9SBM3_9ACTN|nr:proton-conducting transporter membrane subunit [Phytoactinopolyspora halotolerans]NEE02044.1 NADH-quinone oxidoreductase subunit L [Phytoactinopolyspora halotolerans]